MLPIRAVLFRLARNHNVLLKHKLVVGNLGCVGNKILPLNAQNHRFIVVTSVRNHVHHQRVWNKALIFVFVNTLCSEFVERW